MHRLATVLLLLAPGAPVVAQQAIATVFQAPPANGLGYMLGSLPDVDGNGRPDLLIARFSPTTRQVRVISSTTQNVLATVTVPGLHTAAGVGDLDLDGKGDFAVADNGLRAFSGTGAQLWACPLAYTFWTACGVGDLDGDGKPDLAAMASIGSADHVVTVSGANGAQLGISPVGFFCRQILAVGDIDGDGKKDIGCVGTNRIDLYRSSPVQFLRNISLDGFATIDSFAAANVEGDAHEEVLLCDLSTIRAFSTTTGAEVRLYTNSDSWFTVMGDLDNDGFDDLALRDRDTATRWGYTPRPSILFVSGATGDILANWSNQAPTFYAHQLLGVGDVDGDGYGDLLLGDEGATPTGLAADANGGYQLVSGRILAAWTSMPVNCGAGPFLPELGTTRAILGLPMTIVGRDAPPAVPGVLALSTRPEFPTTVGFSGCDVWLASDWGVLYVAPPAPMWSLTFTVPAAAQLAGAQFAMQAFYPGTASPIGIDFTNGLWMRVGF